MKLDRKPHNLRAQQNCEAWYYRMPTRLEIFVRTKETGPTVHCVITKRQVLAWLGKDRRDG